MTFLAVASTALGVGLVTSSQSVGATTSGVGFRSPQAWANGLCAGFVAFQAAALDVWDAAFPIVRGTVVDRSQMKAAAKSLQVALQPPSTAVGKLTKDLERRGPSGRNGAALGSESAAAVGVVADAYAAAIDGAAALKQARPNAFATRAPRVLTRLDAALAAANPRLKRLEGKVRQSPVADEMAQSSTCTRLGLDWSPLSTAAQRGATAEPQVVAPGTPGADDIAAPAILLPQRYRPTPDIAAVAARTMMTGAARTYFYASQPLIETGPSFASHCPAPEASTLSVLGCYHDNHIYVLAVTRPELATVVDVTAAHEMLHAVYDSMTAEAHAIADPELSAFYDATPDVHLHRLVALYEQRTPQNRATELHSLVGTQVATLTPELDAYYAQYFHDRTPVVSAYQAYISVFDVLTGRYDDLSAQITDLRGQITSLRDQASAASSEAQRLGAQIDSLRAQGRISESNTLVPAQNDAVRRANSLQVQANNLVAQHNVLVDQINDVSAQLGGLESALRPLG